MSSILSTSIYGSSTNKGMGGLLSGLDTDELVTQMTAGTRSKINKQYQAKQKLLYRQEAYREISTKLIALNSKYFSYSSGSKTNILSSKFFEANTFKSSSDYVNVTGNADSIKNFEITSISKVATAANFASSKAVSSQEFSSDDISEYISSLAGETFSLDYDGTVYNFTISEDFGKGSGAVKFDDIKNELNKQLATMKDKDGNLINEGNSKLKFDKIGDDGTGYKIGLVTGEATLAAASDDFRNVLDMKVGEVAVSQNTLTKSDLTRTAEQVLLDGSITFTYNGVSKTISLSGMKDKKPDGTNYTYDINGMKDFLQDKLNNEFGNGKVTISLADKDMNGKNELLFSASGTNIFSVSGISKELSYFTGLKSGDSNRIKNNAAIGESGIEGLDVPTEEDGKYSITINGKPLTFAKTATFNDIIKAINDDKDMKVTVSYSSTTDTFSIKSDETGDNAHIKIDNIVNGSLAYALFGEVNVDEKGTDTELTYTMNGGEPITITRSTANFTIDDISIELNEKAKDAATADAPVTFDVTNNVDEVVERVKEFIDEYNEIITLIDTETSERPDSDYPPLTPEQQDEMTEEEIKNWTEEAKKGILYSDSKMRNVLTRMRGAMGGITDVSSLTLSNIGISHAYMDTSGKLVFDEDKFKEKLMEDPEEVENLFSGAASGEDVTSGIAVQLREILVQNVGISGSTGLLIEEAGMDNSMTSDSNFISERIEEYDDKMADLKDSLEDERERYWNKFTALEESLNQLNSQSSWLTDMLGN